jgi:hypothetical protein
MADMDSRNGSGASAACSELFAVVRGIHSQERFSLNYFNVLKLPLEAQVSSHYDDIDLSVFRETHSPISENIRIPVSSQGCRITRFDLKTIDAIIFLVHEIVACRSDIDFFVEEQDFVYNCMEIQEDMFLFGNIPDSPITAPVNDETIIINTNDDFSVFEEELQSMNSLISRYMPGSSGLKT